MDSKIQQYLTDKEIYDDGKIAFSNNWRAIPPASITFMRRFAALTWLKGWTDARDCKEDDGIYGEALKVKVNATEG